MSELSLSERVLIPEAVVSRDLGGETVVLNLETGVYFGLDQLGTEIWNDLRTGQTLAQTVERLLKDYDVPEPTLSHDVLQFVSLMASKGLVQRDR